MTRVKLLLSGLLAVCAIGAVASSAASAHEFLVGGKAVVGAEKFAVKGEDAVSFLKSSIAHEAIIIECKASAFEGELEKEGKSTGRATFSKCRLTDGAGEELRACGITEPIEFKFVDLLVKPGSALEDEFRPESGETFVEIHITGCALKNTYKVNGHQTCELPGAEVEKEVHEIVCKPTGSTLMLGPNTAEFESTEKVTLPGKKWSAR